MALLVLGPLSWGAVPAQNDLHDLRSDRANPRKATATTGFALAYVGS